MIARLLRPVINISVSIPAATASSAAYSIKGLFKMGISSFGIVLAAGKKHVPNPTMVKITFLIF
jgi:hypothetical protein